VPWAIASSKLYHDAYWFPCVGKKRAEGMLASKWGELFEKYK